LKCVLGVVLVTEYRAADAEHHRSVSLYQSLERRFAGLTVCCHEPLEQLLVGYVPDHSFIEERVGVLPDAAV
jgi:hypothetical protein